MLWLTFVLAAAAIASAVFAYLQARVATASRRDAIDARNESRNARDEIVELSREANASFTRQAEAQERANEIESAKLPKDEADWALVHIDGVRWAVRNIGRRTAENANLHDMTNEKGFLRFETMSPQDIAVNDLIEFTVLSGWGTPNPRVEVRWQHGDREPIKSKGFTIISST